MPLGIRPVIDFAFQKTFGSIENKICLLSLLNAILELDRPVVDVTLESPFNLKEFDEDKLSIVDVKARDDQGSVFHIEIQLSTPSELVKRMVFYGCELYSDQLRQGDNYVDLKPVYSICLLNGVVWKDARKIHHRFRLTEQTSGRVLDDTLEVHILELARYNLSEGDLGSANPLECWLYWLLHAQEYETDELLALFPDAAFQKATQTLATIKSKSEEKTMYDSREKAIRDYHWRIDSARAEGEAKGRAEGKAEGKAEGIAEGIAAGEAKGEVKGNLMGRISILESVLNLSETPESSLQELTLAELETKLAKLQKAIQDRPQK